MQDSATAQHEEQTLLVSHDVSDVPAQRQWLKYGSLLLMVVQTSSHVLLLRYSRTVTGQCSRYTISVVVLASEVLKLLFCATTLVACHREGKLLRDGTLLRGAARLGVPAFCFAVQNNLQFVAATYLPAATLQIVNQFKTVTTAVFGVCMLRKWLHAHQWAALSLLVVGVVLAQWRGPGDGFVDDPSVGIVASLVVSISSGFASVYLEKVLKDDDTSLLVRNLQLSLFAIPLQMITIAGKDWSHLRRVGLLHGFCWSTWIVVLMFAFGGMLVSAVIRFADNNLKSMAMAASILLSTIVSIPIFGVYPTPFFSVGAACVVAAIFLYSASCPSRGTDASPTTA